MQQPSAQGIASLYRGNPQPLQQVIQKEQQAKPGLPPDLQKLLALQIVNNEKDGFAAQKAMQQLQQMGGQQGGKPPTVMQSLEQQAQQKMQAQAVQAQRQQQSMQAMAQQAPSGPVPEGTPQPQDQPEARGIDQLPAEFGMAGGGIVAFSGEERSDVPKKDEEDSGISKYAEYPAEAAALGVSVGAYKQAADLAARLGTTVGEVLKVTAKDAVKAVPGMAKAGLKGLASGPAQAVLAGGIPATQFAGDVMRSASPEQREGFYDSPMMGAMSGDAGLAAAIMNESKPAQEVKKAAATAAAKPQVVTQNAPTQQGPGDQFRPRWTPENAVKPIEKTSADVSEIDNMLAKLQGGARPAVPGAPRVAAQPAAPAAGLPGALKMDPRLDKLMNLDPEAERKRVMEERAKLAPDDTWTNKLMAEYEQQKKALAPKRGFEGLAEFFSDVSRAGQDPRNRMRGSFQTGAVGALTGAEREKANAQQQFEFTKQMMELGHKRDEAKRTFQLETAKAGEDAYKNAYTLALDGFKEKGLNDRQASANATSLATTAMQVAESARGHTLTAQSQLMQLKLAEKRADKDASALQLKALSETAKELGSLLKEPTFAITDEGKRTAAMIQSIAAEVAKRGGVDLGQAGFTSAPTTKVRPGIQ